MQNLFLPVINIYFMVHVTAYSFIYWATFRFMLYFSCFISCVYNTETVQLCAQETESFFKTCLQ